MGTRGSQLALAQAMAIRDSIVAGNAGLVVDVDIIKTTGDVRVEERFQDIGSKGLFTKELDEALLSKRIDFAVHSMKDLPSALPPGLTLACVPTPEDCRDAFLSRSGIKMAELTQGSKIGTSSMRRQALLRSMFPHLQAREWRGNIESRVKKMQQGEVEGIFLAYAGLKRLGLGHHVTELLDPKVFVPAVGQGMLAIVCRAEDETTRAFLSTVHDETTYQHALIQRHFMHAMQGGCSVPLGCHLEKTPDGVALYGYLSDFQNEIRCRVVGTLEDGKALVGRLLDEMLAQGSETMLATIKKSKKNT